MARFVSSALQPIALLWLVVVAAAARHALRGRPRRALGPALLAAAIWLVGGTRLPLELAAGLERPWAGFDVDRLPLADAAVMLGGGLNGSSNGVFGFEMGASVDRVITAAEIVRRGKAKALALGGSAHGAVRDDDRGDAPTEADLLRRWLLAWNVVAVPIHGLGDCRNTRDEAVATASLARELGWRSVILVTSAAHMRRSEAVFRKAGLEVIPAPCDFEALARLEEPAEFRLPSIDGFGWLGAWMHERIGYLGYRLRGWID